MLSACLSRVISKIRATYFTARMLASLQFSGHEIVYFGILKYHLVQEKPEKGILPHTVGLRGLVGPLPALSCPAEWPTHPALVSLITYEGPPQAGSDGTIQFV